MHVAFVSQTDARDIRSWSGTPYHMSRALAGHVDKVSLITPLSLRGGLRGKARRLLHRLAGREYLHAHTEAAARGYAEATATELRRVRPDVVLAPSSLPLAYLDTDRPTAFWTDATFESLLYFYASHSTLPEHHVNEANRVEAAALARNRAVYASGFAARSAVDYYGAQPSRVHVVPFGANLHDEPSAGEVASAIDARPGDCVRLLFLGVDWVRKGGDVAVLVADVLNRSGLPTTLDIVGSTPVLDRRRPYVHVHGFVGKETAEGRARIHRFLAESHFLMMPVRAEAFGCVFCEASAYGLPSVTTTSGGAGSAVADGVNGLLFPPRPSPEAIASRIIALVRERAAYRDLARSTRAEYNGRLNWRVAAGHVVELLGTG